MCLWGQGYVGEEGMRAKDNGEEEISQQVQDSLLADLNEVSISLLALIMFIGVRMLNFWQLSSKLPSS